ncbi:hypothetical protein [Pelagibius litoralis]|uniref:hypothetical protein n=1 Tax=Pelagibius litoralis TaxID=374515 RepID=UPI001420FBB5|nr:hypothetical protein [Pelagibius litoralis]
MKTKLIATAGAVALAVPLPVATTLAARVQGEATSRKTTAPAPTPYFKRQAARLDDHRL